METLRRAAVITSEHIESEEKQMKGQIGRISSMGAEKLIVTFRKTLQYGVHCTLVALSKQNQQGKQLK